MKDLENIYGYDEEQAKGKWFKIDGIKVELAYADSPEIEAKVHEKRNEIQESLNRELSIKELEEIGTDAFVEHVLLNWDEELKVNGDSFPCNEKNKRICVKKYPQFINKCILIAKDNKKFQNIEQTIKK